MASTRTPRADATKNKERILAAARAAFATADGATHLEDIATAAGIGVATLYRHYPSREALVATVFQEILDQDLEPVLTQAENDPCAADGLRVVLARLVTILATEQGLAAVAGGLPTLTDRFARPFLDRLGGVLLRAQAEGSIRADAAPADLAPIMLMLIATIRGSSTPHETGIRYLSLLLDGLRPTAAPPLPRATASDDNNTLSPALLRSLAR